MKKISQIETGGRFLYGGVEWVKLYAGDGTVAISAEPVFERAFDEDNKNDWRSSSLRRELNGAFLDALVAEGADRAAFLDWESDLTADDGMTDYGTATDKIALLSDKLYRMFRGIIPRVDAWCWNLTPWTCDASNSFSVRHVNSSGAMYWSFAYVGDIGVRPLCYLKSEILVSVPGEDDEEKNVEVAEEDRAQLVLIASAFCLRTKSTDTRRRRATRATPCYLPESVLRRFGIKKKSAFRPPPTRKRPASLLNLNTARKKNGTYLVRPAEHSRPYCGRTSYLTGTSIPARCTVTATVADRARP